MKSLLATLSTAVVLVSPYTGHTQAASAAKCAAGKIDPYYFEVAVLKAIQPPEWRHGLIRIAVGSETKVSLWSDGQKFELWTANVRFTDVARLVENLRDACRLPANEWEVAALMHIKWEHVDLSAEQFRELHESLIRGLSDYVLAAQQRYPPNTTVIYLDATIFTLVYDNGYEKIEADVPDDPEQHQQLRAWIHYLQTLAETKFHRSVWRH